jgi:stage II sporulation protein D
LVACAALLYGAWQLTEPTGGRPRRGPVALEIKIAPPEREPLVRVALTENPERDLEIEIGSAFRVQPVGSSRVLYRGARLAKGQIRATPKGLRIAGQELAATRLEIIPENSPAVWVAGRLYRGNVRLFRRPGSLVTAVNVLPLEDYVACVIDSEMPASFPEEARKAQAIVARSYALYQIKNAPQDALYDLFASTRSQKYLGYQYRNEAGQLLAGETPAGRACAQATRGMVLLHMKQLFCTYYCAACGGATIEGSQVFEDAAPALASVPCDWCQESKYYRWKATVARADAERAARELVQLKPGQEPRLAAIRLARPHAAGRLPQFTLEFTPGPRTSVDGQHLRQALARFGVNSPQFNVENDKDAFEIAGRGHGHGVGMCQWGARGQALEKKTAAEILQYYYRDAELATLQYE